ncbi:MAG: hypothetical protein ACI8XO_001585 [Verrucomicrobiales bacterium]|jgi:hypothetical protein
MNLKTAQAVETNSIPRRHTIFTIAAVFFGIE